MSRHHHHPANKRGWEAVRRRELRRARRRCERCGHAGRLAVHHAEQPLSEGGTNDQRYEVLCRDCHRDEHNQVDPAREAWSRFLQEEISSC